jgi:hypothetical protein
MPCRRTLFLTLALTADGCKCVIDAAVSRYACPVQFVPCICTMYQFSIILVLPILLAVKPCIAPVLFCTFSTVKSATVISSLDAPSHNLLLGPAAVAG